MKNNKLLILFLFLFGICIPHINASELGTIKGNYAYDNTPLSNAQIHLYKIADVKDIEAEEKFTYLEDYANFNININSLTNNEWPNYASELKKYIETNSLSFYKELHTDTSGNYEFNDLTQGLYLILITDIENEKATYSSLPTLISIPNYDEINKTYKNEIIVNNKVEEKLKPEKTTEVVPTPEVPQTSDDIIMYVAILVFAIVILISSGIYIYKTKKEIDKNGTTKN